MREPETEADRVQRRLLREMGPERRASLMRSMSRLVIRLAREQIRRREPGISDDEVRVRFVERVYGAELAARYHYADEGMMRDAVRRPYDRAGFARRRPGRLDSESRTASERGMLTPM